MAKPRGFCVIRKRSDYAMRYRERIVEGGVLQTVNRSKVLCKISDYPSRSKAIPDAVWALAEAEYAKSGAGDAMRKPDGAMKLGEFVEQHFLPYIKDNKRPSTYRGYRELWQGYVRPLVSKPAPTAADANAVEWTMWLRDVRAYHVQQWLEMIAAQRKVVGKRADGSLVYSDESRLGAYSMKHLKSVLSAIFKKAKQLGYYDGENPVRDTAVPTTREPGVTEEYTLAEIERHVLVLPEPAATIALTFALTALRKSELAGLQWRDIDVSNPDQPQLWIERQAWDGVVMELKTRESKAAIPLIPTLAKKLAEHRWRVQPKSEEDFIFGSRDNTPIRLGNWINRVFRPTFKKHGLSWKGLRGYRSGVATVLEDLGVDESIIQQILRHALGSDVTRKHYIKRHKEAKPEAHLAMQRFEAKLGFVASSMANAEAAKILTGQSSAPMPVIAEPQQEQEQKLATN